MGTTKKLAPYAGVKRVDDNGRTAFSKLWNTGQPRFEGALEFDGEDEFVNISSTNNNLFSTSDNFTLMGWFKLNYYENTKTSFLHFGNNGNSYGISRTSGSIYVGARGDSNRIDTTIATANSILFKWVHFTMTYSNNTVKGYLNGNLEGSDSDTDIDFTGVGNYRIFGSTALFGTTTSGDEQNGEACHIQIWNRALSQSEIQENMYKRLKGDENGLVAYYPLDEIVDIEGTPSVLDKSSNANHGTAVGSPVSVSPFNPIWEGSDRPEYHKTAEGIHQLCVEKETTNELGISNSDNLIFEGDWDVRDGANLLNREQGHAINGITNNGATLLEIEQTSSSSRIFQVNYGDTNDEPTTVSCFVHNIGEIDIILRNNSQDSGNTDTLIPAGEQGFYYSVVSNATGQFFTTLAVPTSGIAKFLIYKPQGERSAYPTLFTEGTRLAPNTVIKDALPETGTIAGVVERVLAGGPDILYMYSNTGSSVQFAIQNNSDNWYDIRGYLGGGGSRPYFDLRNLDSSIQQNTFITHSFALTYDSSGFRFWVLMSNGSIGSYSHDSYINPSDIELSVGSLYGNRRHNSYKFEKPLESYSDYYLVNATDDEIKAFFEDLVKGTSMEMKASEMTIVE